MPIRTVLLALTLLVTSLLPAMAWSGTLTPELISELQDSFRFNGKPIHPALIQRFESWLSDPMIPTTVSVDVAAAADTNEFSAEGVTEDKNGIVSFKQNYKAYAYQWQGRLKNGLHVVHTWSSGKQGSAVMQTLLFLRQSEGKGWTSEGKPYSRLLLTCERAYPLGDRTGVTITLKNNDVNLKIKAYPSGKVSETVIKMPNE